MNQRILQCLSNGKTAAALSFCILLSSTPAAGAATKMVDGYSYQLHNATPPADAFDKDPSTYHNPATSWVEQGPHYTMSWGSKDHHTVERASFAHGRMRMGLFATHWDLSRPSSNPDGWASYGRPLAYRTFNVDVRRADGGDRRIDGEMAKHYILTADFSYRYKDGNSNYEHETIHANLWTLGDKPFSFIPFSTAGMYGDPRLDAAMSEKLSKLGLVVRVESTAHFQAISKDGKKLGDGHDGTFLTWLSDIKPAKVPDVHLPTVSYMTTTKLQHATWQDADGTCHTVINGGTPDFVKKILSGDQRAPFLKHLRAACVRRAKHKQSQK